jgi:hypothetical protein
MSAGSLNQSGMNTLVRFPEISVMDEARMSAPLIVCGYNPKISYMRRTAGVGLSEPVSSAWG